MYRKKRDKNKFMVRSCVLSLQFMTKHKRNALLAVLRRYRSAVNFYLKMIWNDQSLIERGLRKENYEKCHIEFLSARYKTAALKQAIEMVASTIKSAKELGVEPEDFEKVIKQEIAVYNKYVNGEVYRFTLYNEAGEIEDSCCGFYNIEDIRDHLPEDWKDEDLDEYLQY